jgi:hypothetical protein
MDLLGNSLTVANKREHLFGGTVERSKLIRDGTTYYKIIKETYKLFEELELSLLK